MVVAIVNSKFLFSRPYIKVGSMFEVEDLSSLLV